MSLFKNKNQQEIQEESTMQKETILPEVMTMSYSKFVAQEHDSYVDPIKAELKALEERLSELRVLYQEAIKSGNTDTAKKVSEATRTTVKQQKDKKSELAKTEHEYRIDFTAKNLAHDLDVFAEYERLFSLYLQIRRRSIELRDIAGVAVSLAVKCGTTAAAANDIFWSFNQQIMNNMQHDFDYHIHKPDRQDLLTRLEARLQQLKVESDKKAAMEEKIKGIEGV